MRRREIDAPLRRDVRLLGRLLGEALARCEGADVLAAEEEIRKLAIARRRGPMRGRRQASRELARRLAGMPTERALPIIRAFSAYFRLVNVAEHHHRIRRARAHARERGAPPQRGSLAAVLEAARDAGVNADRAREAIATLEVTLTLTAHPTEATRRTLLEKLHRVAEGLEERDRSHMLPDEREGWLASLREEIAILWQTDELRRERPSVGDEVKNALWYVEEILWDVLPTLPERLARAFERAYREPLGTTRIPVRVHSWVGGDMDGNPFVTPDVLEDAIRAYRARGVRRLLSDVRALGGALSQSVRYVAPPAALLASIEGDLARMPAIAARERKRTDGEPFRRKLRFIEARLTETLAETVRLRARAASTRDATDGDLAVTTESTARYRDPGELVRDLELVVDALRESGCGYSGERRARAVLERVRALGLSAAELELRVLAADAREAARFLREECEVGDGATRLLRALERIRHAHDEAGPSACRTLVLSMTHSADDVLDALDCVREMGPWDEEQGAAGVDIVPLFETVDALRSSPAILRTMLADGRYRRHLEARGVQEVMVGYSDSGKEAGLLAASAALRKAQAELPEVAREARIPLRVFHGRGESVARGGGPAQQAILALPRGSVGGRYKATEQGEALDQKYGSPELALRSLELIVGGVLLHTLGAEERRGAADEARYAAVFDELAEVGRRTYRALVWDEPRLAEFFRSATPIDAIGKLPIGSRPSKRRAGGIESLRAIPWVFAWTQSRVLLPGWYGVGSALEAVASREGGEAALAEMYARWPFFRVVVGNVEMELARSDMRIAARYARLAPRPLRDEVWPTIREEHRRTRRWISRVTGSARLLDGNPTLQRSIQLRNPYVDPLSFLQVELLKRQRAGSEAGDRALLLTINGIAAGMHGTG